MQRKRGQAPVLVAAIGVAAVSYVSTQTGCAAEGAADEDALSESSAAYDDDEGGAEVESATQELAAKGTVSATSIAKLRLRLHALSATHARLLAWQPARAAAVGGLCRSQPTA